MKMRAFALVALGLVAGSALVLAQDAKTKPADTAKSGDVKKDLKSRASYAAGLEFGRSLKNQCTQLDLDPEMVLRGIRASLTDAKPELTEAEQEQTALEFRKMRMAQNEKKMQESAPADFKAQATKNKQEGEKFLAANKTKPGVKTTASGLQYLVEKEGKGATPKASDTVSVHYRGTLLDGTEFDSSIKRGQPTSFRVDEVIPGWTEALQLMKVGSKYKLFIPSELAYRFAGSPPKIGPNSTLVFEVELLGIE